VNKPGPVKYDHLSSPTVARRIKRFKRKAR